MAAKKAIVIPEDQLPQKFAEACNLLAKIRHWRLRFESTHDAVVKAQMKKWEARADEYLLSLHLEDEQESTKQEPETKNQ